MALAKQPERNAERQKNSAIYVEMKSEVKFVLKKKWWMVGSVDHLPLHLWSLLMEFGRLKRRRTTSSGLYFIR